MRIDTDSIFDIVRNSDARVDFDALTPSSSLRDSGFDSLDIALILLQIQESFGVEVPDEDVEALDSIEAIVDYLRQRVSEET